MDTLFNCVSTPCIYFICISQCKKIKFQFSSYPIQLNTCYKAMLQSIIHSIIFHLSLKFSNLGYPSISFYSFAICMYDKLLLTVYIIKIFVHKLLHLTAISLMILFLLCIILNCMLTLRLSAFQCIFSSSLHTDTARSSVRTY